MTDAPESLILRYLRQIDQKVDRVIEELHDLKIRMTAVEENSVGVHRRIDRAEARLDRIERRLNLADAGA